MGKLRVLSGKEVCKILERQGFSEVHQRESHIVMQRQTNSGTVTVRIPDHAMLAVETLRSIIRQSGLARELFES